MGKPLIVYCNVPAFKKWPTNFKLLFQALVYVVANSYKYTKFLSDGYVTPATIPLPMSLHYIIIVLITVATVINSNW